MDKWKIERIDRTRWLVELYFNNIPKMPQTITLTKVYNRKPTEPIPSGTMVLQWKNKYL